MTSAHILSPRTGPFIASRIEQDGILVLPAEREAQRGNVEVVLRNRAKRLRFEQFEFVKIVPTNCPIPIAKLEIKIERPNNQYHPLDKATHKPKNNCQTTKNKQLVK